MRCRRGRQTITAADTDELAQVLDSSSGDTLIYKRSEWELAESTLDRMADLAGGTRAAAFHYQRGRILMEHLSRSEDGLEAFRKAHQADRNHVSTTLALQSLYAAGGQYSELCDLYAEEGERLGGADGQVYFAEAARIAFESQFGPIWSDFEGPDGHIS